MGGLLSGWLMTGTSALVRIPSVLGPNSECALRVGLTRSLSPSANGRYLRNPAAHGNGAFAGLKTDGAAREGCMQPALIWRASWAASWAAIILPAGSTSARR